MLEDRGIGTTREGHDNVPVYTGLRLRPVATGFSGSPIRDSKLPDYMEEPVASCRNASRAAADETPAVSDDVDCGCEPALRLRTAPGENGTVAEEGEPKTVAEAIPPAEGETLLPEKAQPVAVTKHRGEPADQPIPDDATLLAEAEAAGWPRVEVAPATSILPGEAGWRRALPWLGPAERRRALAGLRDLASGPPLGAPPAEGEGEPLCACGAPAQWLCCGEPVCEWHMCVSPNPADGCNHPAPPPPSRSEGGAKEGEVML